MRSTLTATLLAALLLSTTAVVARDDPPKPGAGERAERRAQGRAKREAAQRERAADGGAKDRRGELRAVWKKLAETRKERRKQRVEAIQKKWGDLATRPPVKAELTLHARRMARLNRMRVLAQAEGKDALVARIDKLIVKETARHDRRMQTLKTGDAK